MREFKTRKIEQVNENIKIEIEFQDNGDRKTFLYPVGEGWENEINDEPKFIHDICRRVEYECLQSTKCQKIAALKTKHEGKIMKKEPGKGIVSKVIISSEPNVQPK